MSIPNISALRNKEITKTYDELDPSLRDFYSDYDPLKATVLDRDEYESYLKKLSDEERAVLEANKFYYQLDFENIGGLVMPIIVEFTFADGTKTVENIPAEIWRKDYKEVSKVFVFEKEVTNVVLDPFVETADTDTSNNYFPNKPQQSRFDLYQGRRRGGGENPMQRSKRAMEKEKAGN